MLVNNNSNCNSDLAEEKGKNVNHRHDYNKMEGNKPQAHNFSFQTCKVTYGGVDGAYYTSSRTRRAGSDGVSNFFWLR